MKSERKKMIVRTFARFTRHKTSLVIVKVSNTPLLFARFIFYYLLCWAKLLVKMKKGVSI